VSPLCVKVYIIVIIGQNRAPPTPPLRRSPQYPQKGVTNLILPEKWKIKALIAAGTYKLTMSVQGHKKESLLPIYGVMYVKTPDHVVIIHPDLESIQN
jgi:hypothetical protein